MPETLLLLHGFTQTGRSWDAVVRALPPQRYRPVAPDLHGAVPAAPAAGAGGAAPDSPAAGPGATASAAPSDLGAVAAHAAGLAGAGPFALAGYSMGGRIALQLALAHPERVSRLVLLSTTAGIEDAAARAARRAADEALAARIELIGTARFADEWAAQPLFAGQPPEVAAAARADRLRHDPAALAATLRRLGTGTMAPLWDRLGELRMPVAVLAGERDPKFTALGERLAAAIPGARLTVVPGAGHDLVRGAPEAVAAALEPRGVVDRGR